MTAPAKTLKLLSEIEAALRLSMSPELLEYFTRYAPKAGNPRKLPFTVIDGQRHYDPAELDAFDSYLAEPWPKSPKATRPHIPGKLREEIKLEAHCGCAICAHSANGEVAHIEPLAATLSHHPKNLIWLCPNHHTEFDLGLKPRDVDLDTVRAIKKLHVNRRRRLWQMELSATVPLLQFIAQLEEMKAFLANARHAVAHGGATAALADDINSLHEAATALAGKDVSRPSGTAEPLQKLAQKIVAIAPTAASADEVVQTAREARDIYLEEIGHIACPVCRGDGSYDGDACPACGGEGSVDEVRTRHVDWSEFDLVACPLCQGKGRHRGETCPACQGERRMQRRYAEQVVVRDYDMVPCPLCEGSRHYEGSPCPECAGEGEMPRHAANEVDLSDYHQTLCPACDGAGARAGQRCDVCDGNGEIDKGYARQLDPRDFAKVECRLCNGSRSFDGMDCPACGGEGSMDRRHDQETDWGQFKMVDCPRCDGAGVVDGEECRGCGGERRMLRLYADRME